MKALSTSGLLALLLLAACAPNDGDRLVGTLERDRIEIPAELSEPVIALYVREGARLRRGEKILELDPARALAERERLAALAAEAQHRLDELQRGPREETIREARARLAAADGQFRNAERELARIRTLHENRLASATQRDNARAALDQAKGEHDAARAALEALLEGTTIEELEQARAHLAAAQAAVKAQDLLVARLTIKAPADSRVESLPWKTGSQPPRGANVAVLLADSAPFARVYIPASRRKLYPEGADVTVHVPHFGDFAGKVRWVSSEAAFTPYFALTDRDRDRLSYAAEIALGNDDARDLPSGLPVNVLVADKP